MRTEHSLLKFTQVSKAPTARMPGKLQDTKAIRVHLLHFYILITNYQQGKVTEQSHFNGIKKYKIPAVNLTKEVKD